MSSSSNEVEMTDLCDRQVIDSFVFYHEENDQILVSLPIPDRDALRLINDWEHRVSWENVDWVEGFLSFDKQPELMIRYRLYFDKRRGCVPLEDNFSL